MPGMTSLFAAPQPGTQPGRRAWCGAAHLLPGFGLLSKYGARFVMPAGERVRSFTIVTTLPNELRTELHNRMRVVLRPQVWPEWLGEEPADPAYLKYLLATHPAEEMTCWPVSTRVGSVKNNDPSLIEPVTPS